jgi:hypothetical protein
MARVAGLVAILVVVNDWLTTRSSYDLYSADIFVLDLSVILILNGLPFALTMSHVPNALALFWCLMASCELFYAVWDLAFRKRSEDERARKSLSLWTIASLLAVMLYGANSYFQFARVSSTLSVVLDVVCLSYVVAMLIVWNVNRYRQNAKAGLRFLD